jgi:uncharacterized protein (TIGR03083 family)
MDVDAVWAAIDDERVSLADLLETLTADEWATPSLCSGWTVKDVAAHVTLSHIGRAQALASMARYGGNFNRMVLETARRRAGTMPTTELVRALRAMAGSRRHPLFTSDLDPLVDVLAHGQDIAVPLGRERPMPLEAAMVAADRVWSMGFPYSARRRLRGLRLEATDADWARGAGAPVLGPIAALLLLLTGRDARTGELTGDGLAQLSRT